MISVCYDVNKETSIGTQLPIDFFFVTKKIAFDFNFNFNKRSECNFRKV